MSKKIKLIWDIRVLNPSKLQNITYTIFLNILKIKN